jgi:hypothetical protein
MTFAIDLNVDRVGMSTEPRVGLEECDFMALRQQVGRNEAGDAASDDGDLHASAAR